MKLYLLRHTESIGNESGIADSIMDLGLSEKGKKDAIELIPKLSENKYDIFIVSSLKRTIQTIEPFLDTIEEPIVIVEPLTIERNLGEFTGTPLGTFTKYCESKSLDRVSCKSAEGESIEDVYKRAEKFFELITKKYSDKSILISGHKIFLHCLTLVLLGISADKYYLHKQLTNGEIKEFNF